MQVVTRGNDLKKQDKRCTVPGKAKHLLKKNAPSSHVPVGVAHVGVQ